MAFVDLEQRGSIGILTMNRPEALNALNDQVLRDLDAALDAVEANDEILVVILTGAGRSFVAGADIGQMKDFTSVQAKKFGAYGNSVFLKLENFPKPVIAAVNGPAVGAGCDLTMMCDMRIASTRAWFAESFVNLGIIPGDGGAWLLTKTIGPARAAEMALTGDRVDAATALDWGMVNSVVEPDALLDAAHALAERVAKNPPHSVRMAKKLLRESQHQSLSSLLELSAAMQALAHHTEDHREALAAFNEKRPGEYTGK